MGLISLPDPVSMFETWKNAGEERDIVEDFISNTYSSFLNFLYGNRKLPLLGAGLEEQAFGTLASIMRNKLFTQGKIKIVVNNDLWNADRLKIYTGGWITPVNKEKK